MLGYVVSRPRKKSDERWEVRGMPADLRRRLKSWVDVDEVGAEGLWLWLRAVVPLLPQPNGGPPRRGVLRGRAGPDSRELEQRLMVFARENSRLTVLCNQIARDNEVLARRLRAMEAAIRTLEMAGGRIEIPPDADIPEVTGRYLDPDRAGRDGRA